MHNGNAMLFSKSFSFLRIASCDGRNNDFGMRLSRNNQSLWSTTRQRWSKLMRMLELLRNVRRAEDSEAESSITFGGDWRVEDFIDPLQETEC